jgi:hypothetical protein
MAVIEIDKNPSRQALSWFGLMFLVFFGLVGGLVSWQFESPTAARGIWGGAALVVLAYYAMPRLQRPIYLGWLYMAFPIGWVISHLVMAAIFYGVITPMALVFKISGRDALQRTVDRDATSYWTSHRERVGRARYFEQF